jgi:pilus assembly protein Flp/PilA
MEKMWTLIKKFVKEEEGMEMVEYAVVAALVIIAAVGVWATLGQEIVTRMTAVITAMQGQTT